MYPQVRIALVLLFLGLALSVVALVANARRRVVAFRERKPREHRGCCQSL
jgi:hypothetical protein